jgi:hypothetical protein
MPFNPNPGAVREGWATITHPDMPGESGEVPVSTLNIWRELGWRAEGDPESPAPADDTPAPEGDTHTSEEDN